MAKKHHYQQAYEELLNGDIDSGLWAMASSEAVGDETQTRAIYLRLRAEELGRNYLLHLAKSAGNSVEKVGDAIGIAIGAIVVGGLILAVVGGIIFGVLDGIFGWTD